MCSEFSCNRIHYSLSYHECYFTMSIIVEREREREVQKKKKKQALAKI